MFPVLRYIFVFAVLSICAMAMGITLVIFWPIFLLILFAI